MKHKHKEGKKVKSLEKRMRHEEKELKHHEKMDKKRYKKCK